MYQTYTFNTSKTVSTSPRAAVLCVTSHCIRFASAPAYKQQQQLLMHEMVSCSMTSHGHSQFHANISKLFRDRMWDPKDHWYEFVHSISRATTTTTTSTTVLIKSCQAVFADLIATFANLSFSEGTFPSIFKTAVVTPRLKKQVLIQILLKITDQFPTVTISRRSLSVSFWPEFNSI